MTRSRLCANLRLAPRRVYLMLTVLFALRCPRLALLAGFAEVEPLALHRAPVRALAQKRDDSLRPPDGVYLPVAEVLQDPVEGKLQEVAPAWVALQAQLLQKDGGGGEERPQADGGQKEGEGERQGQGPEGEAERESEGAQKLDHRAGE